MWYFQYRFYYTKMGLKLKLFELEVIGFWIPSLVTDLSGFKFLKYPYFYNTPLPRSQKQGFLCLKVLDAMYTVILTLSVAT